MNRDKTAPKVTENPFMPVAVAESMPPVLRPLLANGFVMGVIAVLLMEHVIYRNNRR